MTSELADAIDTLRIEADAESSAKARKSHAFIADELPITAGRFTTRGRNSKRQY